MSLMQKVLLYHTTTLGTKHSPSLPKGGQGLGAWNALGCMNAKGPGK